MGNPENNKTCIMHEWFGRFTKIPREQVYGMPPNEFAMIRYLRFRLNQKTGQCNPGLSTIARDLGWCRQTVVSVLRKLRDDGIITWEPKTNSSNQYTLLNGLGGNPKKDFLVDPVDRIKGCSAVEQSVYIWLLWHMNFKTKECHPTHKMLAEECGLCERTVRRTLSRLRRPHDLINWVTRENRTANDYVIFL